MFNSGRCMKIFLQGTGGKKQRLYCYFVSALTSDLFLLHHWNINNPLHGYPSSTMLPLSWTHTVWLKKCPSEWLNTIRVANRFSLKLSNLRQTLIHASGRLDQVCELISDRKQWSKWPTGWERVCVSDMIVENRERKRQRSVKGRRKRGRSRCRSEEFTLKEHKKERTVNGSPLTLHVTDH